MTGYAVWGVLCTLATVLVVTDVVAGIRHRRMLRRLATTLRMRQERGEDFEAFERRVVSRFRGIFTPFN